METTGAATAIARRKLSSPMRHLLNRGLILADEHRILDYGCGRGSDVEILREWGHDVDGWDPHWAPGAVEAGAYDIVTCHFVLNVIDPARERDVLSGILTAMKPGALAFITVRRDIPRAGQPGRGCFQRWVECPKGWGVEAEKRGQWAMFWRRK